LGVWTIIAVAGRSKRVDRSINRQILEIKDNPLLVHTLKKFCQYTLIESILILVPED